MAGRTIEIDLESYELLTASKRFGESFSSLIKRMPQAERHAASHLLVHIGDVLYGRRHLRRRRGGGGRAKQLLTCLAA